MSRQTTKMSTTQGLRKYKEEPRKEKMEKHIIRLRVDKLNENRWRNTMKGKIKGNIKYNRDLRLGFALWENERKNIPLLSVYTPQQHDNSW